MNILYVEDNEKDSRLVQRYIQTTPHNVMVASKLEDINFNDFQFDLILLDIYFGGKTSGLDYLNQIRNRGIECPVVAITGMTLPHQIASYYNAGIETIIEKPFEITQLADVIKSYEI